MKNLTNNNYSINSLVEQRWSPRAFAKKPIENEKLQSILEAARWAPSAFNEQPWRFILGQKGESTYDSILSTLTDWNIIWASNAPVLILNIAKQTFTHNGKENITSDYDLGQAVGFMILEVVNQGLFSHQMSGFDPDKAAKLFNIPDDFKAISVTVVGYFGDKQNIPEDMAAMETKPRLRNDLNEIVFGDKFGGENHL